MLLKLIPFYVLMSALNLLISCSGGNNNKSSSTTSSNYQSNDPLFPYQWALKNTGQNSFSKYKGTSNYDLNVGTAAEMGFTGKGVRVAISDSGIQHNHEDLVKNYSSEGSKNFLISWPYDGDPTPDLTESEQAHGTAVAGIIGAIGDNSIGIRGVAPNVTIGGFNYIASGVPQTIDRTLLQMQGNFDIFNYSYGFPQYQYSPISDEYRDIILETFKYSSFVSRGGKGSIYVKSSGNEFLGNTPESLIHDYGWPSNYLGNSNFSEDNNYPYIILVGAMNAKGIKSSYSSPGSNIWVSAPGGEFGFDFDPSEFSLPQEAAGPAILSTDYEGCFNGSSYFDSLSNDFNKGKISLNSSCNYTSTMNGTSSAAPNVSGVIALMLEANPELSWRDIKHILASTSQIIDKGTGYYKHPLGKDLAGHVYQQKWVQNAAGYKFHNYYGFGLVDAGAAVTLAKDYDVDLGEQVETINLKSNEWDYQSDLLNLPIPNNSFAGLSNTIEAFHNLRIEAVKIETTISHSYIDNVGIELISPSGTKSIILNINSNVIDSELKNAIFLSNAFYGEKSLGRWTIRIVDGLDINPDGTRGTSGKLISWKLKFYGHVDKSALSAISPSKVVAITHDKESNSVISSPEFSWQESSSATIIRYEYCLGTLENICDVYPWTNNKKDTSVIVNGLNLQYGSNYFVNIVAVDSNETRSEISSSSWTVINSNEANESGTTTDETTTGETTTDETTTGETTTGGTTTGGATTGETTTGGTTTGGTTTGGTTTGGTTTGGTTTGGTTTEETTSDGSTNSEENLEEWSEVGVSAMTPTGRYSHKAIWTGSEMIIWGGIEAFGLNGRTTNTGGHYNPISNSWTPLGLSAGAPSQKDYPSVIWTGDRMIIWGGSFSNSGSLYEPTSKTWSPTSITGAPAPRHDHSAVWTGIEMIVWGGADNSGKGYNDGGIYNPTSESWTPIPGNTPNTPSSRRGHTAIWTGSEMIIWGGHEIDASIVNTGAKFNPSNGTWTKLSTAGAPTARMGHYAIWTGTEMIIWGQTSGGGLYNPLTNTWRTISTTNAPIAGVPIWTGDKMIVWRGNSTGGIYDPILNTWNSIEQNGAPSDRTDFTAVWTGTEMIIWGGINNSTGDFKNNGSKFKP